MVGPVFFELTRENNSRPAIFRGMCVFHGAGPAYDRLGNNSTADTRRDNTC